MSNFRGLVPILLVTALGIGNGIYVFDPAFKEQNQEKLKEQHPDGSCTGSGASQSSNSGFRIIKHLERPQSSPRRTTCLKPKLMAH
ncbi:hypothetical protein K490DRAFT_63231 [Saccharata proteae CBS 121410]|uniref:Uncharacterized protein n=1 Tax=Saccharata proteae CBS 121410 TaxID=1314787 RepID=A0A9P4HZF3_9PEZI|nr:hypothetical protein K490DRAFT_63231 [Saccharata proteae CBS 121410]